jgi:hypothetical protein
MKGVYSERVCEEVSAGAWVPMLILCLLSLHLIYVDRRLPDNCVWS